MSNHGTFVTRGRTREDAIREQAEHAAREARFAQERARAAWWAGLPEHLRAERQEQAVAAIEARMPPEVVAAYHDAERALAEADTAVEAAALALADAAGKDFGDWQERDQHHRYATAHREYAEAVLTTTRDAYRTHYAEAHAQEAAERAQAREATAGRWAAQRQELDRQRARLDRDAQAEDADAKRDVWAAELVAVGAVAPLPAPEPPTRLDEVLAEIKSGRPIEALQVAFQRPAGGS